MNFRARNNLAMAMTRITLMSIAIVFAPLVHATNDNILPPPKKISEHVYAWIGPYGGPNKENRGFRMNMAFVVGKQAVAVLETGYTEAMAQEMLQHIAAVTPLPVLYAVNSNSQPDRYFGNEVFRRQGATIITHELEAKRMAQQGGNFAGAIERSLGLAADSVRIPTQPNRIVKSDTTLDLGGIKIHLQHFGAAHTPAPLVVHVPADRIVYAGDVLYSGRLLAVLPDGNVKSWIQVFDKLKSFGDATFIPGHGEPAKLEAFVFPTRAYLELLYSHMQKMVNEGIDMQEAINRVDQSKFSRLENFKELAGRNASWAYLEREKAFFNE